MALRVLVADDSAVFRRAITDALATIPDVTVIGTAPNGKIALQKVIELQPDLLTLDIEMPELDGIGVLEGMRSSSIDTSVIVVSAVTQRGGRLTMQALEKGAFDFVTKPQGMSASESIAIITKDLTPRIRALAHRRQIRAILRPGSIPPSHKGKPSASVSKPLNTAVNRTGTQRPEFVLIGVSTGGPAALARILPMIPSSLGVPILIVQHMPPFFTQSLAESLASRCSLTVIESGDNQVLLPNHVYIAPGGRQMKLVQMPDRQIRTQLTDDPPENNCKPSVDYLFRSASLCIPGRAMAVILTGMGNDGTNGLRLLRRHGCYVIAQDEATSVVFGMPKAAIEANLVDIILPVDTIAARVTSTVKGRPA